MYPKVQVAYRQNSCLPNSPPCKSDGSLPQEIIADSSGKLIVTRVF